MNELSAELPAVGVVRVVGPEENGAGFVVSASGLIVTCAHVLVGCATGATVRIEPHAIRRSLSATVDLLQDPPDVAVLRLTDPVPPEVRVLLLGRSPRTPQPGLRTFGYPQMKPEVGLPGELDYYGPTADDGYQQLALRSNEATFGFSGAPIWDPELHVVLGMVKSIARGDPGSRLANTAIGVPVENIRELVPELRLPGGCPYRGLEPFTEEHVDYYYGREHATSQLLTSLADGDFVPVVAVSGGGKSSLLQAGLAKGLRDRPVVGLAQRIRCYQRVGSQPRAGLLQSLAQHGVLLPQELAAAPPQELATAIRAAVPPTELIVVVDQFERLYTDCKDAERKRFVALLQCLATDTVKVVIGLRADFYHLALADLGERLAAGQVALAPMSEQDLGRAIAAPAEKLLRSFQPGLTQELIADVRGRPGDLPLLQFALTELWERDAAGGVLTEETYRDLGVALPDGTHLPGAQGALIRRAEQLRECLDEADRLRLQRILLGLIAAQPADTSIAGPAVGARDLSRPARLAQWDENDQCLIQRLIDARLLTAEMAPAGGQPTVEVSHEALLRAWPRLRSWLKERSKFVQWRAQDLAPNLERWLDSNKNPEFLLPPSLLDPALRQLNDYPDQLAGPPADYIRASKRRRTRRLGLLSGAVAILLVASLAAAGIFFSLQQRAQLQAQYALSRQLAAQVTTVHNNAPDLALLLGIEALQRAPSDDKLARRDALLALLSHPYSKKLTNESSTTGVAFTANGRLLASLDWTSVRLWDVASGQLRRSLSKPYFCSADRGVAFSPDDSLLVHPCGDKVLVWDVASGRLHGPPLVGHHGSVESVAFSPDGKTIASAGEDKTVRLWDAITGKPLGPPLIGHRDVVKSVAFSPDGKTLASTGYDKTVRLWQVATGKPKGLPLQGHCDSVIKFSHSGRTLACGDLDGGVRLWDVATGKLRWDRQTLGGWVNDVAFSPDNRVLASASEDGTIRIWNTGSGSWSSEPLTGHTGEVYSVVFSPDGKALASASDDRTVRLWQMAPAYGQVLSGHTSAVKEVTFGPDNGLLASASEDGTVRLWDTNTMQPHGQPLLSRIGPMEGVAVSPDGALIASVDSTSVLGGDSTVQLWDAATGKQHGRPLTGYVALGRPVFSPDGRLLALPSGGTEGEVSLTRVADGQRRDLDGLPTGGTYAVAFSPDGKTLAAGSGEIQLWDVATGKPRGQPLTGHAGPVLAIAFSPDGQMLASGGYDGTIRLWNVATGKLRGQPLTGHAESATGSKGVNTVAFSPDGHMLASGGDDGTVRLWELTSEQPSSEVFTGHTGEVTDVSFRPDGKMLASAADDGEVRIWYLNSQAATAAACRLAGRNLTRDEWDKFIGRQYGYHRTCAEIPVG